MFFFITRKKNNEIRKNLKGKEQEGQKNRKFFFVFVDKVVMLVFGG